MRLRNLFLSLFAAIAIATSVAADADVARLLEEFPKLTSKPFGKGIFAHVRRPGGRIQNRVPVTELAKIPHIAGSQLSYTWSELEPEDGVYRWEIIEQDLEPWARQGKKCWIEISTADKRAVGPRAMLGTPSWIFDQGVPKIHLPGTAAYPVFWDEKYKALWSRFIFQFADQFDGDPRIEFLATGGYSSGHEPNLSSRDNATLMAQWEAAGFDGMTPTGVYFREAIAPIFNIHLQAFQKTPLAQTIHVKTDFDEAINQLAAKNGTILISNGMSIKVASSRARKQWQERRVHYKTKIGYAEWGPAGRRMRRGRRAPRANGPTERPSSKTRGGAEVAKLMDVYRGVLGDDKVHALQPISRLSYLPLGYQIPQAESQEEWLAALQWAAEHLED